MKTINKARIVHDIKLCGVSAGDTVLMHSALSAIGFVEGGADAVIDAFTEVLGEDGTLAVSTLSFSHPFDAETTKSGVGIISETLRKRPNAFRSLHPIHSIAAVGKNAEYLTRDHDKCDTGCGAGTPYVKLVELRGKIVLLGVDLNRNTTLHSIEDILNSCYLEKRDVPMPTYMENYEDRIMTLKKFPPGHRDFLRFTPCLRRAGALREGRLGNAVVKVIDVCKMFEAGKLMLSKDPMFFLCENPECDYCGGKRADAKA